MYMFSARWWMVHTYYAPSSLTVTVHLHNHKMLNCIMRPANFNSECTLSQSIVGCVLACRSMPNARPMLIHTLPPHPNSIVNIICDSFRKALNWDALTRRFGLIELDHSIVQQVLLQLKEPADAKRALGFFHWSARQKLFQHDASSYAIAIHILVRAKLIRDARALLESVLKDEVLGRSCPFSVVDSLLGSYESANSIPMVFDLFVQTCAKLRMTELGFDVCRYLDDHGFTLSLVTYNTLIHVVQKSDQTALLWKIYEHMIRQRTYPSEVTVRMMISALCKEGKLQECVDMLDRIHGKRCSPTVIVNTVLLFRIFEEGRAEEAMVLLKRMLQKNMILDTISYSLIVYAKVKLGPLDSAQEVYEKMLNRGFHANSFVYTLFIGANCKEGRIDDAFRLMEEMRDMGLKPYDETFHHLIVGCTKAGRLEESVKLCQKMMEMGFIPAALAFNEMIGKLCENGGVKEANEMLTVLLDKGFNPDEITYSHLIGGYAKEGKAQEAVKLYYEMKYRLLSPGSLVFESLISSLSECGELHEAERYLKLMKDQSLPLSAHIYEKIIASQQEKGNKTTALQLCK